MSVDDMTPAQRARYESRREREFYSYYEPFQKLARSDIAWTDLNSPESVAGHRPFSSQDKALTAFCQLAAIRLGMRRAMVFFFDSSYAYILAEATRTLSLQDDDLYEAEDALWLGTTKIPRGFSVCEHTVNLPANAGTNSSDEDSGIIHIINNLAEDTRFCNRPYVTDGPKARFYAGVPITTPNGLNIGAFVSAVLSLVLDDKTHDGLDQKATGFLREMGATIMDHLEMVRASAEQRTGSKMVAALGSFMEGTSDPWRKANHAADSTGFPYGTFSKPSQRPTLQGNALSYTSLQDDGDVGTPRLSASESQRSMLDGDNNTVNLSSMSAATALEDPQVNLRGRTAQETVQRAAELIQTAVGADGVLFLDASVSGFGELVNNPMLNADPDHVDATASSTEGSEGTQSDAEGTVKAAVESELTGEEACAVLGASYQASHSSQQKGSLPPHGEASRKLLHSLLRRYKRGYIWHFSQDGEDSSASESYSSSGNYSNSSRSRKRRQPTDAGMGREIGQIIPGVRSLILLGLWDPTRDKWYAGCIVWSCSPMRVFSNEGEMNYLAAFCDVIMARIGRLEVELANKAKSDFISSISHELRSPLHGILGTVEMLQEQVMDPEITQMISQIEVCGRTLSDTVDHLLDFSKINSFATKQSRVLTDPDRKHRRGFGTKMKKKDSLGGLISVDADVALDKITEEVIETAVYSYCCSKDEKTLSARKITTVIDIDRSLGTYWNCRIAVGAWKRVCINLVNNALKYTAEGYVLASLRMIPPTNTQKRPCAQFTVTDSGHGMSKEYLENRLFLPFTQEDDLAEGTGLGMSMVATIVRGLGGKVDIKSGKGVGTAVTVTIPLEMTRRIRRTLSGIAQQTFSTPRFSALSMNFLGSPIEGDGSVAIGRSLQMTTLRKACSDLNILLPAQSWAFSRAADLAVITEADVPHLVQLLQDPPASKDCENPSMFELLRSKPLLVICNDYMAVRRMKKSQLDGLTHCHVEYVAQPCGPERLATAVQTCLDYSTGGAVSSNNLDDSSTRRPDGLLRKASAVASHLAISKSERQRDRLDRQTTILLASNSTSENSVEGDTAVLVPSTFVDSPSESKNEYPFPQLPIVPEISQELSTMAISSKSSPPKAGRRSLNPSIDQTKPFLLLVDDNPINLQLLVTYAKKKGHRKLTAANGLEAVEAYKAAAAVASSAIDNDDDDDDNDNNLKPRVVLMDISMPVMDGFEATRQIRAFEQDHGIEPATIVALTGLGSAEAQREAFVSGVDLFLTKPVKLKELTALLKAVQEGTSSGVADTL